MTLKLDGSGEISTVPEGPVQITQLTHPDNTGVANIRLYNSGASQFLGYLYVNGSEAGGTGLAVLELTQSAAEIQNTQIVQSGGLTYFTARNGSSNGDFYFRGFNGSTSTNFMRIAADGQQSSVIPGGSTLYPEYKCRAWVNFNGTGTVAIRASGNVSSITDNGTGEYTVNFSTAMPDNDYSVVATSSRDASVSQVGMFISQAVYTTTQVGVNELAGSTFYDVLIASVAVFR